jgi:hypothetical protein
MIVFNVPVVIPTRGLWIFMMIVNGIIGLVGQVCSSNPFIPGLTMLVSERHSWPWVFKGRQHHVALSPCIPQCVFFRLRSWEMSQLYLGCFCHFARVHRFPYDAYPALDRRGDHYHEFGSLYISTITSFRLSTTDAHALTVDQKGCCKAGC